MMFEDLDKFIAENPEEVLVTGGWTDDKVSELEKQLGICLLYTSECLLLN